MKKYIGLLLLLLGIGVIGFVLYSNSRYSAYTRTFSPYTLLQSSWEKYKVNFLSEDGRILDDTQDNITTSEGQSYALLRAVWSDDRATFDKVWVFTKNNMQHKDDWLFGWKWGKLGENKYGFLPDGGINSASDADSDIALALILAGRRWSNEEYLAQAKQILGAMWEKETAVVQNKRYLTAGNWAQSSESVVVNPSYFAPYAWRIFATVDTEHDWNSLIGPAYELLNESSKQPLDTAKSIGLPPDWVAIEKSNGALKAAPLPNLKTNYSYDAMRIPWRIALDYQWNRDARAYEYLSSLQIFSQLYKKSGYKLASSYSHDGTVLEDYENPTMYATAIGYFKIIDPQSADKVYQEKILDLYSTDKTQFKDTLPYYEQNWLWFGAALYNERLVAY